MKVKIFLDKTFFRFISKRIRKKQAVKKSLSDFLLESIQNQDDTPANQRLKLKCCDDIEWANLKYKLHQHYKVDPELLTDSITFQEMEKIATSS